MRGFEMSLFGITLWCLAVKTQSAPRPQIQDQAQTTLSKIINLISFQNENYGADGYKFRYELDDGTVREEEGKFVNGIWTVSGKSTHVSPEQNRINVDFVADDKGYNPDISIQNANAQAGIIKPPRVQLRLGPGVIGSLVGG